MKVDKPKDGRGRPRNPVWEEVALKILEGIKMQGSEGHISHSRNWGTMTGTTVRAYRDLFAHSTDFKEVKALYPKLKFSVLREGMTILNVTWKIK